MQRLTRPHTDRVDGGTEGLRSDPPPSHSRPIRGKRLRQRIYFVDLDRPVQIARFLAWLPKEIHDVPGIDWTALPADAMIYLIQSVAQSPDAAVIAMAVGATLGGVKPRYLRQIATYLNLGLKSLRLVCGITHIAQLKDADVWYTFAAQTEMTGCQGRFILDPLTTTWFDPLPVQM